jgi:microcystin-dependent protein
MSDPFLGEIRIFGGNFAPNDWAFCNGQIMSIAQNNALFSLLGTIYGGDGIQTFALPDLRGRVPLSFGQGPGLSSYSQGEASGTETVTLISTQMPSHIHALNASGVSAEQPSPLNNTLAVVNDGTRTSYNGYTATAPTGAMAPTSIGTSGGNQPHPNMQPYLCVNFIIALQGIYPSRS